MTCDHSWGGLSIWIDNTVNGEPTPDMAWCSRCGERWELNEDDKAAARAVMDGKTAVVRAVHYQERKP